MTQHRTFDFESEIRRYKERSGHSKEWFQRACQRMPGGVSHEIRSYPPYPVFINGCRGPRMSDLDDNSYLDYWMGHYSLLLGHQPELIRRALSEQIERGIMWGAVHPQEVELAELICQVVPSAEKVRFCTTGTEATMFATRLARGFTGKNLVLKMEGGWHGPSSELFQGVTKHFERVESLGMPSTTTDLIQSLPFNDPEQTREILTRKEVKDHLAAIIVEPMIGSSWFIPAHREYLQLLREECDRLNAVLIFDEIITGFRLALGGAQSWYGITPDLTTMGKVMGAGLPIAAVAGKSEIMDRCNPLTASAKWERVRIGGGTFSCHPLSMSASLALIRYLVAHEAEVYSSLAAKGKILTSALVRIFETHSLPVAITGLGSLFIIHFLDKLDRAPTNPREALEHCHYQFREKVLKVLLCNRGVYVMHGGGAVSLAHTDNDLVTTSDVFNEVCGMLTHEILSDEKLIPLFDLA